MKDVFKNYKNYTTEAKKQSKFSKDNFSIELMKEKFIEIINQHVTEEVELKLPSLKKPELKLPKLKKVNS